MDRRLLGVVILVVAVLAGIATPSVTGRRIAGAAVSVPFPDVPQVGQCLIPQIAGSAVVQSAAQSYPPEVPADEAHFGECSGVVGGEVVAMWSSSKDSGFDQGVPSRHPCYPSVAAYAGLEPSGRSADLPGAPPGGSVRWRPTIGFDPLRLVPGKQERAAGRDWVGCLAVPTGHVGYVGTLRNAFTAGSMPAQFGSCWAAADLDLLPVAVRCDQPHPAELLAKGWITEGNEIPAAMIDQSCSQIAARIMHTTDPSRGGELDVVVDRMNSLPTGGSRHPLTIACFVTSAGPRELTDTVIGLADEPVPFVG